MLGGLFHTQLIGPTDHPALSVYDPAAVVVEQNSKRPIWPCILDK